MINLLTFILNIQQVLLRTKLFVKKKKKIVLVVGHQRLYLFLESRLGVSSKQADDLNRFV